MNSEQTRDERAIKNTGLRGLSNIWHRLPKNVINTILDWGVVLAMLFLIIVIYVPKSIWAEEDLARTESRRRMMIIQSAENFYKTLTDKFTTDGPFLFKLVSQTHDSLVGDTTFLGPQVVRVEGQSYSVDIPERMLKQLDTTFTIPRAVRETLLDTTYTVLLWNDERSEHDTIFINGIVGLQHNQADPSYRGITDTTFGSHTELVNDYAWYRYRLVDDLLFHPVSFEPYLLNLDSTGEEFTIAAPESDLNVQRRYLMFHFEAIDHGKIVDGEPSWLSK